MRHFAMTAVRVDRFGRISHAIIDLIEAPEFDRTPGWSANPIECEAGELARLIAAGDRVEAAFLIDDTVVLGPLVKHVAYGDGTEGVELAQDVEGRTYRDLIQLED